MLCCCVVEVHVVCQPLPPQSLKGHKHEAVPSQRQDLVGGKSQIRNDISLFSVGSAALFELVPLCCPPFLALKSLQPRMWKDSMSASIGEHPSGGGEAQGKAGGDGSVFFDDTKLDRQEAGLSGDDDGEEDDVNDMYEDGGGGGGGGGGVVGGEGDGHDDLGQVGGACVLRLVVGSCFLCCDSAVCAVDYVLVLFISPSNCIVHVLDGTFVQHQHCLFR